MNEENKPALTKKEAIDRMVAVLLQIESYNEDLKDIKNDCKDAGLDPALITAVAKAKVSNKLGDLKERSEGIIDLIEEAAL